MLVSLKNIDIWSSYESIWPLLSYFLVNLAEIFHGSTEDFYLSISHKKSELSRLFFDFDFHATFGGKMGAATTRALTVWVLQTQPKSWPSGLTFWVNCHLEILFSKFSVLNNIHCFDIPIHDAVSTENVLNALIGRHSLLLIDRYLQTELYASIWQ